MDLLRHGFYISAGRHAMNEESQVYRVLPEIPADRLLIETDNSDFTIGRSMGKSPVGGGSLWKNCSILSG